ncbi:hypothetical protein [uncultured Nocardioides sp.]|uniref:hypothetical protein n=1 Tax=uncultured Nocardioides sp. TaxID=198441 RepID=UPI0026144423|nr:hypothetical protein [uncultured Nocardioides sp.]
MTSTPGPRWASPTTAVVVGVVAAFAIATPIAIELDARIDRTRPMYDDRGQMEWLQYQSVLSTGQGVALDLAAGESADVAGEQFTPSAGVDVEVRTEVADRPCVRVSNDHGDVSEWACLDPESPPVDPDPEVVDPAV